MKIVNFVYKKNISQKAFLIGDIMIKWIRRNIGFIISSLGLILLIIVTYGDIGELFTEQYWINVGGNLSSISALTVGLMFIIMIKQGVSEQALSKGLNTPGTAYEKIRSQRRMWRKEINEMEE